MFSMKYLFIVCIVLVLVSALLSVVPKGATFDIWTATSIAVTACAVGSTAIIYLERRKIGYRWFVNKVPAERDSELLQLLQIEKITPKDNYMIAQSSGRLVGHAYARITDVPYLIDDLDRDKKLFYVGNFARILDTLPFTFEIIPRIMPISTEAYLKGINKQIEDLRLTISSEGSTANPGREARLKHLEKLSTRLLSGEGARDVGFLAHIMVEGKHEEQIERQLDSNMRTMTSALESGLGVRTERLTGYRMLEEVQKFFRASSVIQPSRTCRILTWDIAYLIPFTRPKIPPAEKLIGGAYLGRTNNGAMVCLDLKKYANPHVAVLGKSGFGKSTTVKTFISRFFDLSGTPILIIDYAGEYLNWVHSRQGTVIDMRKDRINPFELGQTALIDRMRQVIDSFEKTCDFTTINQRNAFAEYVSKAYLAKGYRLNDPETWKSEPPTLEDILNLMKMEVGKINFLKQTTVQSLIHRLEALATGPFGIFGQSTISINQLTCGLTCIDLSKVSSSILKDLIAWNILQYLDTMMRLEGVTEEIRLVVVLDEAWKLCKREDSLPVAIVKEGRKYGYSLIVSTQDIIDVAEPILSNAGTGIIHRTEHPRYLSFFERAYDLTEIELSRIRNLSIGEAMIKLSTDPKPFFTKIEMETAEETQINEKTISSVEKGKISVSSAERQKILPYPSPDLYGLPDAEKKLLRIVAEGSAYSIIDCYRKAEMNDYQGNKAKEQLLKRGLIEQVVLPTISIKGRKPVALVLTEKGEIEAKKLGIKSSPLMGRKGGVLHNYLINLVTQEFQKRNCRTEIEKAIGESRTVDVLVDGRLAVEVETGESDIESNIRKLLTTDFEILFVCADSSVKRIVVRRSELCAGSRRISMAEVRDLPEVISSFCSKGA